MSITLLPSSSAFMNQGGTGEGRSPPPQLPFHADHHYHHMVYGGDVTRSPREEGDGARNMYKAAAAAAAAGHSPLLQRSPAVDDTFCNTHGGGGHSHLESDAHFTSPYSQGGGEEGASGGGGGGGRGGGGPSPSFHPFSSQQRKQQDQQRPLQAAEPPVSSSSLSLPPEHIIEQQRARIKELVTEKMLTTEALEELRELFEKMTRDYESVSADAQHKNIQLESLEAHCRSVEEQLRLSQATCAMQSEKIQNASDEWARRTQHLRAQFTTLTEDYRDLERQRDELLDGHRTLRREAERLQQTLTQAKADHERRLAQQAAEVEDRLRAAFKEKEELLRTREEEVRREARRVDEGVYKISAENTTAREDRQTLEWQLAELERVLRRKEHLRERQERTLEESREQLTHMAELAQAERQEYARRVLEIEQSYTTQVAELKKLYEQVKCEKSTLEHNLGDSQRRLNKDLTAKQEELRELRAASEAAEARNAKELLAARKEAESAKTASLEHEATALRQKREAEAALSSLAKLQTEVDEVRREAAARGGQVARLEGKTGSMLAKLTAQEKETEAYRCALERVAWSQESASAAALLGPGLPPVSPTDATQSRITYSSNQQQRGRSGGGDGIKVLQLDWPNGKASPQQQQQRRRRHLHNDGDVDTDDAFAMEGDEEALDFDDGGVGADGPPRRGRGDNSGARRRSQKQQQPYETPLRPRSASIGGGDSIFKAKPSSSSFSSSPIAAGLNHIETIERTAPRGRRNAHFLNSGEEEGEDAAGVPSSHSRHSKAQHHRSGGGREGKEEEKEDSHVARQPQLHRYCMNDGTATKTTTTTATATAAAEEELPTYRNDRSARGGGGRYSSPNRMGEEDGGDDEGDMSVFFDDPHYDYHHHVSLYQYPHYNPSRGGVTRGASSLEAIGGGRGEGRKAQQPSSSSSVFFTYSPVSLLARSPTFSSDQWRRQSASDASDAAGRGGIGRSSPLHTARARSQKVRATAPSRVPLRDMSSRFPLAGAGLYGASSLFEPAKPFSLSQKWADDRQQQAPPEKHVGGSEGINHAMTFKATSTAANASADHHSVPSSATREPPAGFASKMSPSLPSPSSSSTHVLSKERTSVESQGDLRPLAPSYEHHHQQQQQQQPIPPPPLPGHPLFASVNTSWASQETSQLNPNNNSRLVSAAVAVALPSSSVLRTHVTPAQDVANTSGLTNASATSSIRPTQLYTTKQQQQQREVASGLQSTGNTPQNNLPPEKAKGGDPMYELLEKYTQARATSENRMQATLDALAQRQRVLLSTVGHHSVSSRSASLASTTSSSSSSFVSSPPSKSGSALLSPHHRSKRSNRREHTVGRKNTKGERGSSTGNANDDDDDGNGRRAYEGPLKSPGDQYKTEDQQQATLTRTLQPQDAVSALQERFSIPFQAT